MASGSGSGKRKFEGDRDSNLNDIEKKIKEVKRELEKKVRNADNARESIEKKKEKINTLQYSISQLGPASGASSEDEDCNRVDSHNSLKERVKKLNEKVAEKEAFLAEEEEAVEELQKILFQLDENHEIAAAGGSNSKKVKKTGESSRRQN